MGAILAWWALSAVTILSLGLLVGLLVTRRGLGVLIDFRGRYSLTHLQLSLWTVVISSLVSGIFFGRWQHNVPALGFSIPAAVLVLLGISVGSTVTVTAAKIAKNATSPDNVAASGLGSWQPRLIQILLREEDTYADQVVDITKLQNFLITVVVLLVYIGFSVHAITSASVASKVTALPGINGTFVVLLLISHIGYLAGKLPSPDGEPTVLTVATRNLVAWVEARSVASVGQSSRVLPGLLWRQGVSVSVWSDNAPITQAEEETLVIINTRPFMLRWTTDNWQESHETTAIPAPGGHAVVLLPSVLGSRPIQMRFRRRYMDRSDIAAAQNGWESGDNIVRLTTRES
jgi:hypothetical protein